VGCGQVVPAGSWSRPLKLSLLAIVTAAFLKSKSAQWGQMGLSFSLLDRLLHHNNIVATEVESYRMRDARTRQGARPSKT
jgi:hypothetical protein